MAKIELGDRAAKRELAILKFGALMGGFTRAKIYYEFSENHIDSRAQRAICEASVVDLESNGLIERDNAQFILTQAGVDFLKAQQPQRRTASGTSRDAKQADASSY